MTQDSPKFETVSLVVQVQPKLKADITMAADCEQMTVSELTCYALRRWYEEWDRSKRVQNER